MSCKRVRKLIPLAVGRDLDPGSQRVLEQHLKTCLACYREMRAFRDSLAELALVARAGVEAPAGLEDSIMARVRAGEAGPAAAYGPGWAERARYTLPLAATFLAFAFAGFFLFGESADQQPELGANGGGVQDSGDVFVPDAFVSDTLPPTIELPRAWSFPDGTRSPVYRTDQPIPVMAVPPVQMTGTSSKRGF